MRTIPLMCAVMISVSLAFSQTPQAKPLSPFEQELVNNENQFMQALAEKNVAYVNQSVADDFKGIGTNGDFYDRDELVGMAHEGLPKDVRVYEVRVVRLNDDSAVVTYNLIIPGGRPRYRHMSDTWAKDSGKWKLKFEQTTINLWSATDFD
ncbi:MAG: nuclear transport factor 2 family protein [Terriglobales bacterium]